jgi:radical SAM protein with 4Fe4S-binding SPASM domain|tara:strand:- start:177 stop:533 length:357 start_codon:yes stop_codon:yes gene_type:complete
MARTDPCFFPFDNFYLGFSGNIMPCCHLRSDRAEHENYRIGNLRNFGSIFEAFTSAGAAAWRREMVHNNPKSYPCNDCAAPFMPDTEQARQIFERSHRRYVLKESQIDRQESHLDAGQ